MSESDTLAKKKQISRILDIVDQDVEPQNAMQNVVQYLNSVAQDLPNNMTKEQYYELQQTKCRTRKRNLSGGSGSSTESPADKPLFGCKECIYVDVTEEDSLVKLALKYNCHVSELKYANKIYNEKELHALKTIKVPVVKDGLIYDEYHRALKQGISDQVSELNSAVKLNYVSNERKFDIPKPYGFSSNLDYMSSDDDEELEIFSSRDRHFSESANLLAEPLIRQKGRSGNMKDASDVTIHEYMENMDKVVQEKVSEMENKGESLREIAHSLTGQVIFPSGRKEKPEQYGSVCSITWSHCLIVICLVAVVVPVGYLIYFYNSKNHSS